MDNSKNYCKIHNIAFVNCYVDNCIQKLEGICKYCALHSKEQLTHLAEHFDHIKDSTYEDVDFMDSFTSKLKSEEDYGDLNKIYIDAFNKGINTIDSIFRELMKKCHIMNGQLKNAIFTKYSNFTSDLEDLVKTLSERLNSLSSLNPKIKEDLGKLKKELDTKLSVLSNPQEILKDLLEIINKIEEKIKNLKVDDIINDKFNIDIYSKQYGSLELTTGGNMINVTPRGSSYWITKSQEILEGPFTSKIKVVNINPNNCSSYWNYAVGIIKADHKSSESSYYMDSILIQSNGYIPGKFTSSGSDRQIFFTNWKNNDVIFIKRDENNSVYFALNDENSYHLAHKDIRGSFRIVMGFSASMKGDVFELEEIVKF